MSHVWLLMAANDDGPGRLSNRTYLGDVAVHEAAQDGNTSAVLRRMVRGPVSGVRGFTLHCPIGRPTEQRVPVAVYKAHDAPTPA